MSLLDRFKKQPPAPAPTPTPGVQYPSPIGPAPMSPAPAPRPDFAPPKTPSPFTPSPSSGGGGGRITPAPAPQPTPSQQFQGPVKPGDDEQKFRETGRTQPRTIQQQLKQQERTDPRDQFSPAERALRDARGRRVEQEERGFFGRIDTRLAGFISGIETRKEFRSISAQREFDAQTQKEFDAFQQSDFDTLRRKAGKEGTGVIGITTSDGEAFEFRLTESMLEKTEQEARKRAKQEFKDLPRQERLRLTAGEIAIGIGRFPVTTAGFLGDLGQDIIRSGEIGRRQFDAVRDQKTERFLKERSLAVRELRDKPIGAVGVTAEVGTALVTLRPDRAVREGFKGIKEARRVGFTTGEIIGEGVSRLSPLQLAQRRFTVDPATTKGTPKIEEVVLPGGQKVTRIRTRDREFKDLLTEQFTITRKDPVTGRVTTEGVTIQQTPGFELRGINLRRTLDREVGFVSGEPTGIKTVAQPVIGTKFGDPIDLEGFKGTQVILARERTVFDTLGKGRIDVDTRPETRFIQGLFGERPISRVERGGVAIEDFVGFGQKEPSVLVAGKRGLIVVPEKPGFQAEAFFGRRFRFDTTTRDSPGDAFTILRGRKADALSQKTLQETTKDIGTPILDIKSAPKDQQGLLQRLKLSTLLETTEEVRPLIVGGVGGQAARGAFFGTGQFEVQTQQVLGRTITSSAVKRQEETPIIGQLGGRITDAGIIGGRITPLVDISPSLIPLATPQIGQRVTQVPRGTQRQDIAVALSPTTRAQTALALGVGLPFARAFPRPSRPLFLGAIPPARFSPQIGIGRPARPRKGKRLISVGITGAVLQLTGFPRPLAGGLDPFTLRGFERPRKRLRKKGKRR